MGEQLLESVLNDLLAEIGGPLKESCQPAYNLVNKCAEEDVYIKLSESVRRTVEPSQSAVERSSKAYDKVAEIGSSDESADNKLKYIFDNLAGPIRNGANVFLSFADICHLDFKNLPEEVKHMVQSAKESWGTFKASNKRVGEILHRLPPEKIDEYEHYHTRGKKIK